MIIKIIFSKNQVFIVEKIIFANILLFVFEKFRRDLIE